MFAHCGCFGAPLDNIHVCSLLWRWENPPPSCQNKKPVYIAVMHFSQGEPCTCLGVEAWLREIPQGALSTGHAGSRCSSCQTARCVHTLPPLQAIAGGKSQPRKLKGLGVLQSSDLGTMVTHRAEILGTIFREGSVLRVEKEPMTPILQTLFKTFISAGFEEHPSKLRPQMGWSELDLNLDFTLHICTHIHAHSTAASLIWETGLRSSWDRDQPWHCVPKSPHPHEL